MKPVVVSLLLLSLAACGSSAQEPSQTESRESAQPDAAAPAEESAALENEQAAATEEPGAEPAANNVAEAAPAAAPAAVPAAAPAAPVAKPASYAQCSVCHSTEPGKNMLGPSLAGVAGRAAGTAPGFNFSPALKASGITWDRKSLDAYIRDPQGTVPGNRMAYAGMKDDAKRAELIDYLLTLE